MLKNKLWIYIDQNFMLINNITEKKLSRGQSRDKMAKMSFFEIIRLGTILGI